MKTKLPLIISFILLYTFTIKASEKYNKENRPNFVIIYCDDLGYGDLACFGHPTIKTPNLDKMAIEGQKWTSFYVSASVCSPSRAGLLTGRLGVRTGMFGNKFRVLFPNSPEGLPQSEITIAKELHKKNYITACIGKWHLGHHFESMPIQNGFDYFYGAPFSNDMSKKEQAKIGNKKYPYEYLIYDQNTVVAKDPDQTQLTSMFTQKAISFIQENKRNPFFLYLAHPMPHFPVYSSNAFQGKSARGPYGDTVEEIDWSVGQILKTLEENNLEKNTLVIFTSDNGPWLIKKELGGSAGLLREGKGSICEGGFRVPCIMWGGMVKPGQITDMGSTLDLFPTFCDMADIKMPEDRQYDGVSLKNVITQKTLTKRKMFYYYRGNDLYAIRKGAYKIFFAYKPAYGKTPKIVYKNPCLYNLEHDPEARYDIAYKYPELVKELVAYKIKYLKNTVSKASIFDITKK